MQNLKAALVLIFILLICALGGIGCTPPDAYHADAGMVGVDGGDGGAPDATLPAPQACMITDGDRANSIGVGICTDDAGNQLTVHDPETGYDVKCYRCSGEFNAQGTQPVPPEGCYVWRHSAPIAGLCVNSCMQCGSRRDEI